MRRGLLIGTGIIVVVLLIVLWQPAVDPEDFTGEWYSASGQNIYLFQNGIIQCDQHSAWQADGSCFSGAYMFSGKSVTLFALGIEGLESVKELYLIENKEESLLCENEDGSGQIYFVRHN